MIDRTTPCRTCGYDLRGLDEAARCPECGRAVAESLVSDALRFADPAWLRTVAGGCRIALWATVAAAVTILGVYFPGAFRPSFAALGAGAALARAFGAWQLTTPDPSGLGESEYGLARRAARALLLFAGVAALVPLMERPGLPLPLLAAAVSLEVAGQLAFIAGVAATMRYLRGLLRRGPDDFAGRARLLQWTLPPCYVLVLAPGIAFYFLTPAQRAAFRFLTVLALLALVTLLVFGVMALLLLANVARLLDREAWRAEDHRILVAARLASEGGPSHRQAGA